ncbi:hypothetical protein VP01_525g2 [Puccinia sorghi]|uniref:Uncharacterized protein n=1 Tax=Puccinia sorghi TaxID=27349 RepID=A0A0L6UL77_9BASI|nr:hypothetical protein VP01_525g2 [Puccinia sorghi]
MILDPTFKTTFWKNHKELIQEYYGLTIAHVLHVFCYTPPKNRKEKLFFKSALYIPAPRINGIQVEIQHYLHKVCPVLSCFLTCPVTCPVLFLLLFYFCPSSFYFLFTGPLWILQGGSLVVSKPNRSPQSVQLHKELLDHLSPSRSARLLSLTSKLIPSSLYNGTRFLGNSSNKCLIRTGILSKGRRIVSRQELSLNPKRIEHLLCLRDWFQTFDGPFFFFFYFLITQRYKINYYKKNTACNNLTKVFDAKKKLRKYIKNIILFRIGCILSLFFCVDYAFNIIAYVLVFGSNDQNGALVQNMISINSPGTRVIHIKLHFQKKKPKQKKATSPRFLRNTKYLFC